MFARLLGLVCLLNLGVCPALPDSLSGTEKLELYLKADSRQPSGPLSYMKGELASLMRSAGYRLEWRDEKGAGRTSTAVELVVLELRGVCGASSDGLSDKSPIENLASLAATAVSDGEILPFSWVNCDTLTRMLAPALRGQGAAQRDFLYGRAVARLLAHELYHIILNTPEHGRDGVAKECFAVSDLLTGHFEFEQTVLARFHHSPTEHEASGPGEVAGDAASGR